MRVVHVRPCTRAVSHASACVAGAFRDKLRDDEEARQSMAEQIALREAPEAQSHTAGFEAWLRSRGDSAGQVRQPACKRSLSFSSALLCRRAGQQRERGEACMERNQCLTRCCSLHTALRQVYTAETVAEQFGVVKSSYDAVPLPPIKAYQVQCNDLGKPKDVLELGSEPIPAELEWGEVLVNVRAAPINPGDLYTVHMGGAGSADTIAKPPFVAGNDGLGVVVKVGPGVKNLSENDWVFPFKFGLGTWRSLVVWKEKDLLKMPVDLMPIEYAAMMREMCVAYRLLEDHGNLKPGDSVILNAANSTIGTLIIQLCRMLKLRAIAIVRDGGDFEKTAAWLRSLGATEVRYATLTAAYSLSRTGTPPSSVCLSLVHVCLRAGDCGHEQRQGSAGEEQVLRQAQAGAGLRGRSLGRAFGGRAD